MVLDQIRNKLVIEKKSLLHNELIPHEKVSKKGINQLNNYISNIHREKNIRANITQEERLLK